MCTHMCSHMCVGMSQQTPSDHGHYLGRDSQEREPHFSVCSRLETDVEKGWHFSHAHRSTGSHMKTLTQAQRTDPPVVFGGQRSHADKPVQTDGTLAGPR